MMKINAAANRLNASIVAVVRMIAVAAAKTKLPKVKSNKRKSK